MALSSKPYTVGAGTTREAGAEAEAQARAYLERQGLQLIQRNYRTPGRGGGEIDLIMRAPDGTVVFVEVRHRGCASYGGALASVGAGKQKRIVLAARHFLAQLGALPPCRFDVVAFEGGRLDWVQGAFEVG